MTPELTPTQKANVEFHRQLSKNYQQQPFFHPKNKSRVRSLLAGFRESTAGERLLDIGCGTGFILDLAHDLFTSLDGIDITPEMLQQVTPHENVHTQLAVAERLPFEDQTFDVVTCYSLLHHLPDPGAVFKEAHRVLKPQGVFYADESPSQHYRDALLAEEPAGAPGEIVAREYQRVSGDVDRYGSLYGIPNSLVREAMAQGVSSGRGLREDALRAALESAGFAGADISYRRFIGEDQWEKDRTPEEWSVVREYLTSILPLSRHVFKYFVLIARA